MTAAPGSESGTAARTAWRDKPERGSDPAIRLIGWLARRVGRRVCRALLVPIVIYFVVTDETARRASREFLGAATDRPVSLLQVGRHLFTFATTLLDRVYLANGDLSRFQLTIEGASLVTEALALGRGCLLLGSHLGSFDLLSLANQALNRQPVTVLMQVDPRARLRRIAGIDDRIDQAAPRPEGGRDDGRVIPIGRADSLLQAYEVLREGGLVAMLADRVDHRATALPASFLGRRALFPLGPHVLAARSGAPVVMCFGLYEGGTSYRIEFVAFGQGAERFARGAALQPMVDRYCAVLSEQARRRPLNWFNFYPYWDAP
jgi:predicted LPLAT superfamily acyltransferase